MNGRKTQLICAPTRANSNTQIRNTVRTGGARPGKNDVGIVINSRHVVADQLEIPVVQQIQSEKFVKDSFGANFSANEARELKALLVAMNDHVVVAVHALLTVHVSRASDE